MPLFNAWITRALIVRIRQPEMRAQRRFLLLASLALVAFLIWAISFLLRQATPSDEERAAIIILSAVGALIAALITAAVVIRKRRGAKWGTEEAIKMADAESKREGTDHSSTGGV